MAEKHSGVRVVMIETQYVETDELSFKSAVQRLTGKKQNSFADSKRKRNEEDDEKTSSSLVSNGRNSKMSRIMSFTDLDRMILELPPMAELDGTWSEELDIVNMDLIMPTTRHEQERERDLTLDGLG